MNEQQSLLSPRDRSSNKEQHESSPEEWSDDSTSNSYYSDTDSSVPEWESSMDATGQILYIDCHSFVTQTTNTETETKVAFPKTQVRKSTRSKFLKLLRRRDSKRCSKRPQRVQDFSLDSGTNKVTFQDYENGEIKEVLIGLSQENCFKFGRRATLVESLLGVTVSSFPNGNRVMIAGFSSNFDSKNEKNIKIGDWLKTIDRVEVTFQNLNSVLEQVISREEIVLQLQRVAGVEVTKDPPTNELKNQSNFVHQLTNFDEENEDVLSSMLCEQCVGMLFLNVENLAENGPEFDGVLYCYPRPYEKNILCTSRGIFLTLSHLLNDITKSKPQITSVHCKEKLVHVVYNVIDGKLLLLMLPDNRVDEKEVLQLNRELVRMLEFTYSTLERCFESPELKSQVDHFFSRFFARILSSGLWTKAEQYVDMNSLVAQAQTTTPCQFEDILAGAHFIPLPNEIQMQIDDALSELEASDYRDWNEEPLDCQRLFTILGSALYHCGYLLVSHFIHGDLVDVHSYCRQQGLFHLSRTEPVRSMVLWREVFPFSCNRGINNPSSPFKVPDGKRYLLIIGSAKNLLVVLMEAGGCTEPAEENMGPDAFYVEEVQATLSHIQELGVAELADRWLATNPGPQVTIPEVPVTKRKSDFLSFTKLNSPNQNKEVGTLTLKKPEVTSILKRRSSDQGLVSSHSSSLFSLPDDDVHSEDTNSQGGYSERSEISDEPVLGRRAIREKRSYAESDDEESDIEDYREGSQMSNGSYDLSELRQALMNETEDAHPLCLTVGKENVLFHYVQFDCTEGILLSPPECKVNSATLDLILDNFRCCCQNIHKLFQNTLRFKNMPAQDMAKSVMNKSLIAIKEHGILFECNYIEDNLKKNAKLSYWVIGRLFYMPHPRELYVCYQDTVPQNLIDIAFKLGVSLAG